MKYVAAKYNMYVPIKPAPNIYQILISDRNKIDPLETSGIYRIEFNKDNEKGFCICLTKRRIKEHKGDICNGTEKTAVTKITLIDNININYNKTKKLAN